MRTLSAENLAALQARALVARDFLWIEPREFDTGTPVAQGFWSGTGNVTASVINPLTGSSVSRTWYGSGSLIGISAIPLVANGTVQSVTINMSQLHELVETAVRGYDCKQARVEIFRGLFDPNTRALVAPALCRFLGFVDTIEITTRAEGESGDVLLNCKSHTQEFTRANADTRSDASQKRRGASDNFYRHTGVVSDWEIWWGKKRGKVSKKK